VKLLECSVTTPADTQPAGRCDAATGTCECAAYDDHTFVPPSDGDGDYANSGMYSSTQLGFGACAARIDFVDLGVGADSQSRGKVFHNQTLSPGRWRFYKFDVDPANDHQVVISMNKEISAGSWEKNYASLYVRHETVPTNHWGHYDLPQDFVTGADASVLVTLTEGDEIYQPGTWYVLGLSQIPDDCLRTLPDCFSTLRIKRKCTTYITSAMFGPITLTVRPESGRLFTHTSHGPD
jgi:hypothetical protein